MQIYTKVEYVYQNCSDQRNYEDVTATILQTLINGRYKLTNHIGVLMGITYFNAVVSIDEEKNLTDISYGYDGLFIGMFFGL